MTALAFFSNEIRQCLFPAGTGQYGAGTRISGSDTLPSFFAVTDLAAASAGAACDALTAFAETRSGRACEPFRLDRRLISLWFDMTFVPDGWEAPPVWDSIAGIYRAKDRFIRLHTNAPMHRAAALRALRCSPDKEAVAAAVSEADAQEIEDRIVAEGGAAAVLRSIEEWNTHPQGRTVADLPLISWESRSRTDHQKNASGLQAGQPLSGIKVLDLTRVLAGPVCTRFLAAFGADVLRIDPPGWNEGLVEIEVTAGKRCAGLDLKQPENRARFISLLREADVLVHGYRDGALDALGFGPQERLALNPDLIDVALNAYGHGGPWRTRRGFDSLVQMSSGIADHGMAMAGKDRPVPLPVQALDHATGYLMAAAVLSALSARTLSGDVFSARLALARTAKLLVDGGGDHQITDFAPRSPDDMNDETEHSAWGPMTRVKFPFSHPEFSPHFRYAARKLRSDAATFDS